MHALEVSERHLPIQDVTMDFASMCHDGIGD